MIDGYDVEVRFHSPDDPVLGPPRGEESKHLAFPEGKEATEIEYGGRSWRLDHSELLTDATSYKWLRIVYRETPSKVN